jgi:hypothetical protein
MPRWLSAVLVVAASVLAFAALLAIWIDRQVLDTENWTSASSELLAIPAVQSRTAELLADRAYERSDIEERIRTALPERAQPLAAPVAGLLRDRLERRAREALSRPDVQQLWEDANRAAHQRLLDVLSRSGPVTLDLHALLLEVERRAGIGGRAAAAVPAGAATVTILDSDQLDTARRVVRVLGALPIVLVVLSLALAAAAIGWSPGRRRRLVRGYGIGLVAAGALALGATAWIGDGLVASLGKTADGVAVVEGVFSIYTSLLVEAAVATIGYGIVVVLGAWLAGPTRWAVAVRRALAPYLRAPELAYGALAVLVGVVFLWWAPTPAMRNPATALVLIALLVLGLEALRRETAREFPPEEEEEPAPAAPPVPATPAA